MTRDGADLAVTVPWSEVVRMRSSEHAMRIKSCCRRYMPATAKLLVIERRLPERAAPGVSPDAFLVDLEMLVMTSGGRERTEAQFRSLFAAAGFQHERTIATASAISVFEARPL